MENKRNFYRVLHLQPDAPQAMVRAAYRTIMQKLKAHPDLGGDEWNASLINEAYETLSDPVKRKAYDDAFFASREKAQASAQNNSHRKETNKKKKDNTQQKKNSEQEKSAQNHSEPKSQSTGNSNGRKEKFHAHNNRGNSCLFCGSPCSSLPSGDHECPTCKSPLQGVATAQQNSSDRRDWLRMPGGSTLNLQTRSGYLAQQQATPQSSGSRFTSNIFSSLGVSHRLAAILVDISLTGLRLKANARLPLGEIVRIESDRFIALAEVCNCVGEQENTYGVKFASLKFKQDRGSFVSTAV